MIGTLIWDLLRLIGSLGGIFACGYMLLHLASGDLPGPWRRQTTPHVCQMCERPLEGHWWICVNATLEATQSGLPTENARAYAREFAAEQLRKAASANVVGGINELEAHLIAKAQELWP